MTRVKRGIVAHKKREKTLKYTKGFRWGRKSKERAAKEALTHAWTHAFRGRKERKRVFKSEWLVTLNAALRNEGLKYSTFSKNLKDKNITLNHKSLSELAQKEPTAFKAILEKIKQ